MAADKLELNLPEGFYQASMTFTGTAVPRGAAITFGGLLGGAHTPSSAATAINNAWQSTLRLQFVSGITLAATRVKVGPMDSGPFATVTHAVAGSKAATTASPNVAYLIKKISALGGRAGAGRIFHPGVVEADIDEAGLMTAGVRTTLQGAYDLFFNALNAANLGMHLLHSHGSYHKLDGIESVVHTVPLRDPTPVTSLSVDSKISSQRRRLR